MNSRKSTTEKLWAGRFRMPLDPEVERFSSSLPIDRRLFHYDIHGSIAHTQTLAKAGLLTARESSRIVNGLKQVEREIDDGSFVFTDEDEDIHMAVERRLMSLVGKIGGKLHTGRSRNDQVALDVRMYAKDRVSDLVRAIISLQQVLVECAERHCDVVMPGYTHLQRAQPVLFAHHLLAYVDMLDRDKQRLRDALKRIDVMPLGSGALAGPNFPLDRKYTARILGFRAVTTNSLDAVSDRDFILETLGVLSILMTHLSRLSEELIVWSSSEFRFVELDDAFCTGSSMMPQKKNPDVPELVRGKTGRVYGHLVGMLTVMKGLPLSYNRDLQEDKVPLFDAVETASACVSLYPKLLQSLTVNREVLAAAVQDEWIFATDLADYLVARGVPFREAHYIVGRLVRFCSEHNKTFADMTLKELQAFAPQFDKGAIEVLTVEGSLKRRSVIGGTARRQVERRLGVLKKVLHRERNH